MNIQIYFNTFEDINEYVFHFSAAPLLEDIPEEVFTPKEPVMENLGNQDKIDPLKQEIEQITEQDEEGSEESEEPQEEIDELVNPKWIRHAELGQFKSFKIIRFHTCSSRQYGQPATPIFFVKIS